MLKTKIHRATVTGADLTYEGSISLAPELIDASGLRPYEQVDIYNCNNGSRFHTYVIVGKPGEVCLNGAAARHVHRGDVVIIAAFASMSESEASTYQPTAVFVDEKNAIVKVDKYSLHTFPKNNR
jgi:aspartate 1-decarboxylase